MKAKPYHIFLEKNVQAYLFSLSFHRINILNALRAKGHIITCINMYFTDVNHRLIRMFRFIIQSVNANM